MSRDMLSSLQLLFAFLMGGGILVVRSRLRGRRVPGSKPDSTEDPSFMWAWCTLNRTSWLKHPPTGVVSRTRSVPAYPTGLMWCGSLEKELLAQVLSSPSGRSSE
ncbi:hypothetical protein AVEN_36105-1 [Araneus ventricosus]|uniref:Uncharacterized protein n=1 Tax=Araneus ventricosus TaxID=182803 RepID=A0A4Y2IDE7_ARAVE|nr:hypothetical protein AVEN_36105-1 [Araneus ventricosus]